MRHISERAKRDPENGGGGVGGQGKVDGVRHADTREADTQKKEII